MEEYAQTEIKKENERKLYFKRIERNANNFMTGVAKEALDKQERENKEEEAKMIFYQKEKEKWEIAKEKKEAEERERNKKELAKYYKSSHYCAVICYNIAIATVISLTRFRRTPP